MANIPPSYKNVQLLTKDELGHGSYGVVYKAKLDKQLICAAKVIHPHIAVSDADKQHRQPLSRFKKEIKILEHVHHPNIVQYLQTYDDPNSGYPILLMEYMDKNLTRFLKDSPGDIPYHTQVNLSYDIAQALAFLHSNGIIHRDLSSNNVLLAGTRAKISDFGMAKLDQDFSMTKQPGTKVYMPPEALDENPDYTEKLDNFSFGVLQVQIMTRKFPRPTKGWNDVTFPETSKRAKIEVSEVERRRGHISLIQQDHPLLPMALECLKDRDQERPSSQELCGELTALKRSDRYEESSQQDPNTIIKQLQAQNQVEIREKNEQIQLKEQHITQLAAKITQATQTHQQELQAQNQQHQVEIREKNEQIQLKDQKITQIATRLEQATQTHQQELQLLNQQEAIIEEARRDLQTQADEIAGLEEATQTHQQELQAQASELASRERQLRSLNEQNTATLQQELIQRDRQVSELREMLATRDRENQTTNNDRLSVQHLATPVMSSTTQRAQHSEGPINMRWESLPNAPGSIYPGSSAVIGFEVYITTDGSQNIDKFDYTTKRWYTLSSKHPLNNFTIVNVENKLTTVGGYSYGQHSNKIYKYENGKWIEVPPPMPTKRSTPTAAYTNNTLVVAGGNNGSYLSTVEILNTTSRQWSSVSSLPFTTSEPSLCINGDHVYIHPGYTNNDTVRYLLFKCSLTALVQSRPSSQEWKSIGSLPVTETTLTSVNGHLIIVGGEDNGITTSNVYQYDETNEFGKLNSMSVARYNCLTALLPDNKLMVFGGASEKENKEENEEASKSIEIATIT